MSTAYLLQAIEITMSAGMGFDLTDTSTSMNLNYYSLFLGRVREAKLSLFRNRATLRLRHPKHVHLPAIQLHPFAVTQQHIQAFQTILPSLNLVAIVSRMQAHGRLKLRLKARQQSFSCC